MGIKLTAKNSFQQKYQIHSCNCVQLMQPLYTQYTTFATPQIPNTQRSQLIATYRSVVSPTHAQLQGPDAQLQKKESILIIWSNRTQHHIAVASPLLDGSQVFVLPHSEITGIHCQNQLEDPCNSCSGPLPGDLGYCKDSVDNLG